MKIPCKIPSQLADSYAIIRTGLWRRPDALQCLEALASKTSGRQDARSSFSNFYSELGFSQHLFGKFLQDVRTTWQLVRMLPSILEYFEFSLQAWKGVTAKTVRKLGQAVWTWTYYGKNCAILERQSQKTVRTRLSSIRTLYSQSPNLSRIRFSEAYIKRALGLLFVRIQYIIP